MGDRRKFIKYVQDLDENGFIGTKISITAHIVKIENFVLYLIHMRS
jgi:hypothetical protein